MNRSRKGRFAVFMAILTLAAFGALDFAVSTKKAKASTVHTVASVAESGPGSLRDAIASSADGDTIVFNVGLPATIGLTSGEIDIDKSITITGPAGNLLTISGSHLSRIFKIATRGQVNISGLTIANGTDIVDQLGGGGVSNGGALTVTNCIFISNQAVGGGGGIDNNGSALTVANCTFDSNSASGSDGGAIINNAIGGSLLTSNCTFSNNTAGFGGGISNEEGAIFSGENCTFANNKAAALGGAIEVGPSGAANLANCTMSGNSGGGIVVSGGTTDLQNTIIADSIGGPDCLSNVPLALNSHNLIKDGSCSPMLAGSAMLGPLQNNGGATPTMALLPGSPAIDAGDDSVLGSPFSLSTDQRGTGFPRKSGLHVDRGAFEFQVPVGPSFDTCLKDNTTGNLLQWNRTSGQYQFTRCSDNFTLSGTGTVSFVNGIRTLTDFKSDRRISAGFNTGQLTGTATIYLQAAAGVWQTFRIVDTNPSAVCKC